jgi:predicted MPP superfamily phosphohydrolase
MNPFIFVFLFIHTLINLYIFVRGWQALPHSSLLRTVYVVVFFIFYSSFFISMAGRNIFPSGIQKILYFVGSTWFAAMLYISLYFLLTDIVHLTGRFFHFLPKIITPVIFHQIQVISGYSFLIIILFTGYYRFSHPSIVEKEIEIHKSGGKHSSLKIVAFSDLHLGVGIDKSKLQKYVQLVNTYKPDIILISGDMIDNSVRPLFQERMYEEINQLEAPLGIYFCPGNHEYISGITESLDFFKRTKLQVLVDSTVLVDDSFWIIGRNDRSAQNRLPLNQLVKKTNPLQALFLLDHQPSHLQEAEKNGIDFQLSGHTHNGQLWPLNYIVDKLYELGHGYLKKNNMHVIVTSGLGLWGPQYRVGTQSELIVLSVRFND